MPSREAAVASDGSLIAVAEESIGPFAFVADARSGDIVAELPVFPGEGSTHGRLHAVAFSPDDRFLVTAGDDPAIWNAENGFELIKRLEGHRGAVWDAGFSPDGSEVATASGDGTIRIWDVETGASRLTLPSPGATEIAYSPDGRYLAAVGSEGSVTVYILDIEELIAEASNRLTRSLTEAECVRYLHTAACPGSAAAASEANVTQLEPGPESEPEAAVTEGPEIDAVLALYDVLNRGDLEAYLARLDEGLLQFERDSSATAVFINAGTRREVVEPCRLVESFPEGGGVVECTVVRRNDFHRAGGIVYQGPERVAVDSAGRIGDWPEFSESDATWLFNREFWRWLRDAHPQVHAAIRPEDPAGFPGLFGDTGDTLTALEYVDEFVAQSVRYPLDDGTS